MEPIKLDLPALDALATLVEVFRASKACGMEWHISPTVTDGQVEVRVLLRAVMWEGQAHSIVNSAHGQSVMRNLTKDK
jgi:hypothetical protein